MMNRARGMGEAHLIMSGCLNVRCRFLMRLNISIQKAFTTAISILAIFC